MHVGTTKPNAIHGRQVFTNSYQEKKWHLVQVVSYMKFIFAKTQNITHNPKELQPKVCSFSMVLLENDFINNEDLEQLAKMMGHGKGSN